MRTVDTPQGLPSHPEPGDGAEGNQTLDLCDELQALFAATDLSQQQACMTSSLHRLGVAGLSHFSFDPVAVDPAEIDWHWVEDWSGELRGMCLPDHAQTVINGVPRGILRWVLLRRRPFWMRRYARFFPFSSQLVLRQSAPKGRRPLRDLIVVTLPRRVRHEALFLGLHTEADRHRAEQLITLASAFLLKRDAMPGARAGDASQVVPSLSERQIECLQWLVAGKAVGEVAMITGLSYANVRYHLERAKQQTGFASLQQLVAFAAVQYGLSPHGPGSGRRH
ncbi:MAG: helix-turn-helix transcriptional regulator [Lysobacterales bacterium]